MGMSKDVPLSMLAWMLYLPLLTEVFLITTVLVLYLLTEKSPFVGLALAATFDVVVKVSDTNIISDPDTLPISLVASLVMLVDKGAVNLASIEDKDAFAVV